MNEKQFQAMVAYLRGKVAKLDAAGDNHPGEPWHLALSALAEEKMTIPAVKDFLRVAVDEMSLLYTLTGIDGYLSDAVQCGTIILVLEMAERMAAVEITEVAA